VLKVLALGSTLSLLSTAIVMRTGVARLARAAEGCAMLALPVILAAIADGTTRLVDRAALYGLLTASTALFMIGGSAASIALLKAAGIGSEAGTEAGAQAMGAAASSAARLVVSAGAAASAGALLSTLSMRGRASTMAGAEESDESPDAYNYRLTTLGSPQPSKAPPLSDSLAPLLASRFFRGQAGRRLQARISPSLLAAGLLVLTTISNPGTFFEVWDGVYNWHKHGGEPLLGLVGAALALVGVQAGLLRPLCRAIGGTHALLCAAHVCMALTFSALMHVDGSSALSYPLLGLFFSTHSLVDSLTATLVSAYSPPDRQVSSTAAARTARAGGARGWSARALAGGPALRLTPPSALLVFACASGRARAYVAHPSRSLSLSARALCAWSAQGLMMGINHAAHLVLLPPMMSMRVMYAHAHLQRRALAPRMRSLRSRASRTSFARLASAHRPFINCAIPMLLFPPAMRAIRAAVGELAAAIADT
jgi:hypothetical protein